ncbi:Co2+/Mg2+ efflux protein ApaG [Thalassotalea sp. PLHSN55]|uniref:Co2+/Mg2+ efflux protein ApaG n=1 Tax=Thalassotalea sp. PLHSN55 TaxID=3435888 RepID=UPI003F82E389
MPYQHLPTAEGVEVSVVSNYLATESNAKQNQFVFTYTITIKNNSDTPVKLMARSWLITDANGKCTNVKGDGVVGEQPTIAANKSYTYSSGCILETPVGTMQGYYQLYNKEGEAVKADIPVFGLSVPNILN